uniref:Glycosyltransferase n=1 Tax=Kalanchoe fedtschenkoi TaxID=63787 RepID=A0A7N0VF30_KALFE
MGQWKAHDHKFHRRIYLSSTSLSRGERMVEETSETVSDQKPHAVCIPFPLQGHINPMLQLAKLLHHSGFHITFVNTARNHLRLLNSRPGPSGLPGFRFETVPDELLSASGDVAKDMASLCESTSRNCSVALRSLVAKLQERSVALPELAPPVTCVVADGVMTCAAGAAEELGVPLVLQWAIGVGAISASAHLDTLVDRGLIPLQESQLTNGHLERTTVDFIPGMKGIRLKDLPTLLRATSCDDIFFKFVRQENIGAFKASAVILNTLDALEPDVIEGLRKIYKNVLPVGPLHLAITRAIPRSSPLHSIGSSLWREEPECLPWLSSKAAASVIYVNYGSLAVMSPQQLIEFAWGLANSGSHFLWIIREDLVTGDAAVLPSEFAEEVKERGLLAGWCPQEEVLGHPAVGGFLTHCGWNSTVESLAAGVPMICWPFGADQQTNCWFSCGRWGVGVEMGADAERGEVEKLVREVMAGDKGKAMRSKAAYWKSLAEDAVSPTGSSTMNFKKLVNEILLSKAL